MVKAIALLSKFDNTKSGMNQERVGIEIDVIGEVKEEIFNFTAYLS